MTDLLQFKINFRKSHRQPQCPLQLVCEDRVLFVGVNLHVSLCVQQYPKCERAIHLMRPHFLCKLRFISKHTNKIFRSYVCRCKQLYLNTRSELDTCSYELFLTMTDTMTSQNIDFSLNHPV
jgi:hypothetical protein